MSVERIGKYRVLAKLGQGGMARVLLTMSQGPHGFNKLLVVKELREELAHDPEFLSMFMDEARIAARLNHPNIVQTYEVGNDGERYFIAMEYLEGQPLNAVYRRIGRKNLPLEIHLRILADVLGGLEHAHALSDFDGSPLGIVHRDISPQNVFVTYDGQVKLVDFGIAKAAGASSRTQEGMLKGKISYIAPEQARCEKVDARADLFAVGVMLWEAVAGRRMVTREDEMSVLARRMAGQDPPVREAAPDVPEELAAIVAKSMAPSVADRFQSARDFQEALERYLAQSDFRVNAKDVGQAVSRAFEDERIRIRATIEEQVRNADKNVDPIQLDLVPASLKQTSDSLARVVLPVHMTGETPAASQITNMVQAVPPRPKSRSLLSALAVGSLLAVGALGLVVYMGRSANSNPPPVGAATNNPVTATATPTTTAPQAPQTAAEPHPTLTASPVGNNIKLKISYPEGAKAKLDGGYIDGNPFIATVAKDSSMHKLEVEEDGFKTEKRTLLFDKDIDMTIELTSAPGRPYAVSRATTATKTSDPAPTQTTPPPPPVTQDPEPKKPPPKSTVELDENNPYKKKKPQ
ncbi:MAG: serine/threonine-protein kinase [Polyangiaceae bacterium]